MQIHKWSTYSSSWNSENKHHSEYECTRFKKASISQERLTDLLIKARKLRKRLTKAEKVFWDTFAWKLDKKANITVWQQHPIVPATEIGFIADFYFPHLWLIIEIDGSIHKQLPRKIYDLWRETTLKQKNKVSIIRFTNEEVLEQIEDVINITLETVRTNPFLRQKKRTRLEKMINNGTFNITKAASEQENLCRGGSTSAKYEGNNDFINSGDSQRNARESDVARNENITSKIIAPVTVPR